MTDDGEQISHVAEQIAQELSNCSTPESIARIYFEVNWFTSAERLLEPVVRQDDVDPWLKALYSWSSLRRGAPITHRPAGGSAGRWVDMMVQVVDARDRNVKTDENTELFRDVPAVEAPAAARLAIQVMRDSEDLDRRDEAFRCLTDLWKAHRDAKELEPVLARAPIGVDVRYLYASGLMEFGWFDSAVRELDVIVGGPVERHVAAHILRVRLDRVLGASSRERIETIDRAAAQLIPELTDREGETRNADVDAWVELHRHRAAVTGRLNPAGAIEQVALADKLIEAAEDGSEPSYSRARYELMTGDFSGAEVVCRRLLTNAKLSMLDVESDSAIGESDPFHWPTALVRFELASNAPVDEKSTIELPTPTRADRECATELKNALADPTPEGIRAIHRVTDLLRASGQMDEATRWISCLHRIDSGSRSTRARLISLYVATGRIEEGLETISNQAEERRSTWQADVLEVESARCYLAAGLLDEATDQFESLSAQPASESQILGLCGLIDVARRRRNLVEARRLGERVHEMAEGGWELTAAEVAAARGWTEIQLGDPRLGLELCRQSAKLSPYDVSAWTGVARALRLLGRHDDALVLIRRLLGAPQERSTWPTSIDIAPDDVPNLSVRHGARLRSELGWSLIDLDRHDDAYQAFNEVLEMAPHLNSAARGLMASLATAPPQTVVAEARRRVARLSKHSWGIERDLRLEAARVLIRRREHELAAPFVAAVREDLASPGRSADDHVRVLFSLVDAYLDASAVPEATELIDEIRHFVNDPTDERAQVLSARLSLARHEPKRAWSELAGLQAQAAPCGETTHLAYVIALFEDRLFERAGEALDELEAKDPQLPGTEDASLCPSDVRRILRAWIELSKSELPGDPRPSTRIRTARSDYLDTDRSSVDEIHLNAIVEARRFSTADVTSLHPALLYIDLAHKRRPQDPALMRDKAAILLAGGDDITAERLLERAAALDATDARTQLLAGVVQFQRGQHASAVSHFTRAATLDAADYVHHRALSLTHYDAGELDDALRAVNEGISRVRTPRILRLEMLRARIIADQALTESPDRARAMLVETAERLERKARLATSKRDSADVSARKAFLFARAGHTHRAKVELARARRIDGSSPEVRHLRREIESQRRQGDWTERFGSAIAVAVAAVSAIALGVALLVMWAANDPQTPDWEPILIAVGIISGLFAFGLAFNRITSVKLRDVTLELASNRPVEELVHVDLDLSASRLLLMSGFSNFRPSVPMEDHEPRVFLGPS